MSLFKVSMTNYFSNVVFLTRNSSITLSEIDGWSYFELEMYMHAFKQALDQEKEEQKKQAAADAKQSASMRAQLRSYLKSKP